MFIMNEDRSFKLYIPKCNTSAITTFIDSYISTTTDYGQISFYVNDSCFVDVETDKPKMADVFSTRIRRLEKCIYDLVQDNEEGKVGRNTTLLIYDNGEYKVEEE